METDLWWRALPRHVRDLYKTPNEAVQVPVIEHIASMFGWPDPEIHAEMSLGFPLLGKLSPGVGWPKREDMKYAYPRPLDDFLDFNRSSRSTGWMSTGRSC